MAAQKIRLGELLLNSGLIDEFQLRSALAEQQRWGDKLGLTLVKLGYIQEEDLLKVLSRAMNLPIVRLEGKRIEPQVIATVPSDVAERHICLPLFVKPEKTGKVLFIGMDDPTNIEVLDDLAFRTGMTVRPVLVGPHALRSAIDRYYRGGPGAFLHEGRHDAIQLEDAVRSAELLRPASVSSASPAPLVAGADEASTRMILRALTQILIEKGVFDRNELIEEIRRVQSTQKE